MISSKMKEVEENKNNLSKTEIGKKWYAVDLTEYLLEEVGPNI